MRVVILGAGLAGTECAYFLAKKGHDVILMESKSIRPTAAQKFKTFAELVCTNSLKSMDENSAHGLLKQEMQALGSLVIESAYKSQVPAGDALAVDREVFSQMITDILKNHPKIQVIESVATDPFMIKDQYQADQVVVATGPLTHTELEQWLATHLSDEDLYFYDSIAPVVDADSLDMSKLYYKDRYKNFDTQADYLNAPLNKSEYLAFVQALNEAQKVPAQNFEDFKFFEGCLPVDVMAQRGVDTLRFSCMKPVGLETPEGQIPYAAVQLRKENLLGQAYNLVGMQNKLTYSEQKRVFRLIPGLENADFIHLGSVHRNTFLHAKKLLNPDMSSIRYPWLSFAGQISGVEGYTESAAMGLYVGMSLDFKSKSRLMPSWPVETAIGALVHYVMTCERPVPSNINFGLLPATEWNKSHKELGPKKKVKKMLASQRGRKVFKEFWESQIGE